MHSTEQASLKKLVWYSAWCGASERIPKDKLNSEQRRKPAKSDRMCIILKKSFFGAMHSPVFKNIKGNSRRITLFDRAFITNVYSAIA